MKYIPPTWTGGGGANANWTNAANWGGTAPVAGADLLFDSSMITSPSPYNDFVANTQFGNMTFTAGPAAFTLDGNAVTLARDIAITNYSANNQTIKLTLSGSYAVKKAGAGTVTLSGTNSFTGGTVVTAGTLIVTTTAGLLDGSDLSIGANVLAAFAAPVVPAAAPAAAAVNAAVAPGALSDRPLSVINKAIQAALADARWRTAAWLENWAIWPSFDDLQNRSIPPLAAHDAVLADYWPGT